MNEDPYEAIVLLCRNVWIMRIHESVPVTKCHQTLCARILRASAIPTPKANLLMNIN